MFCNVSDAWKDRCLMFMTQQCNYNKRRQTRDRRTNISVQSQSSSSISESSLLSDMSLFFSADKKRFSSWKAVQNIMIQVYQDTDCSTSCRSQDLLELKRLDDLVNVNDLNFSKFISLLMKKLNYNDAQNIIAYECDEVHIMHIINVLEWRTALYKMHMKESICFFFIIRHRELKRNSCKLINLIITWFD